MSRALGTHSLASAFKRLRGLVRDLGVAQTAVLLIGNLDDRYLRSFDRRYRVHTSGFIHLETTSFDPARLRDATQYGPANAWAVRRLFKQLMLARELHFADLGCGMGRICILAAEYGFSRVTGVDLAPELCAIARENVRHCRPPTGALSPITILEQDALVYCEQTDADVFFMFRPFSGDFLRQILARLNTRARDRGRLLTIIYSERAAVPGNYANLIAENQGFRKQRMVLSWGQEFHIFECRGTTPGEPA